ncbi:hypothetical protein P3S68_024212 [Capsicum galapagoense]
MKQLGVSQSLYLYFTIFASSQVWVIFNLCVQASHEHHENNPIEYFFNLRREDLLELVTLHRSRTLQQ